MEADLVGAERRISSLPTETLLDIFDHCRVKYYDFALDSISVRGGPLSVTSVCQRWRHVALSTPTLWTDVHLNIYPHPLGDVIARLQSLLERSGDLPLSVIVRNHGIAPLSGLVPALQLLASHSTRWEHADIALRNNHFCNLTSIRGCLPLLRRATIYIRGYIIGAQWDPYRGLFVECPALESFEHVGQNFDLPWKQLIRYSARPLLPLQFHDLKGLKNVRALELQTVLVNDFTSEQRSSQLHLPSLERAFIAAVDLSTLRAPALTECHIYGHLETVESVHELANALSAGPCSLTALSIYLYHKAASAEALSRVLVACPNLRVLRLRLQYELFDDGDASALLIELFTTLIIREDALPLVPKLEELTIMTLVCRPLDGFQSLADAIASRDGALRAVSLYTVVGQYDLTAREGLFDSGRPCTVSIKYDLSPEEYAEIWEDMRRV
ncbi:uncharacterized protein SCHCODRAFT_02640881 [Schizophyllum commune H4-8]|nr:uncharacterized protein SCHCODRAFT_02640881 [Schizophyllum commune H4-8]KAI5887156.1 hypothetical protein SCHCODRAFT_02640881 [Schizophyllum commune H4-8]